MSGGVLSERTYLQCPRGSIRVDSPGVHSEGENKSAPESHTDYQSGGSQCGKVLAIDKREAAVFTLHLPVPESERGGRLPYPLCQNLLQLQSLPGRRS